MEELIRQLEAARAKKDMWDAEFAKLLGISRPMYSLVRSVKSRPGVPFFKGVLLNFPEMEPLVIAAIKSFSRH